MTKKGYKLYILFDWETLIEACTLKEKLNRIKAKNLVERLHESWSVAQGNIARLQERYAKQANKHYRVIDFRVSNKV